MSKRWKGPRETAGTREHSRSMLSLSLPIQPTQYHPQHPKLPKPPSPPYLHTPHRSILQTTLPNSRAPSSTPRPDCYSPPHVPSLLPTPSTPWPSLALPAPLPSTMPLSPHPPCPPSLSLPIFFTRAAPLLVPSSPCGSPRTPHPSSLPAVPERDRLRSGLSSSARMLASCCGHRGREGGSDCEETPPHPSQNIPRSMLSEGEERERARSESERKMERTR